ncbi:ferredoxin [Streptomyces sp. NPDC055722]
MRVRVHEDRCQGHAMCAIACPGAFVTDENSGRAHVVSEVVPAALEDDVLVARDSCPEEAIQVY